MEKNHLKKYQLIREYPGSPVLGTIAEDAGSIKYTLPDGKSYNESSSRGSEFERLISSQTEYWKEVVPEGYKIMSFKQNSGIEDLWTEFYHRGWCRNEDGRAVTSPYTTKEILDSELYDIHSVRRLSDNVVFSIGDFCKASGKVTGSVIPSKINKIERTSFGELRIGSDTFYLSIDNVEHSAQKLFTTEDGVDIYLGDKYFELALTFEPQFREAIYECTGRPNINYTYNTLKGKKKLNEAGRYYFSTKEAAEKYIRENKPVLSYKDVEMLTIYSSDHGYILNMGKLRDIVKKRMK